MVTCGRLPLPEQLAVQCTLSIQYHITD